MKAISWILVLLGSLVAQESPKITAKHIDVSGYPAVARQAQLQGTISMRLTISSTGEVTDATANTNSPLLVQHPLLQHELLRMTRRWTFQCLGCRTSEVYEHTLIFVYKLEGKGNPNPDRGTVSFDLPNTVTIRASKPMPQP